MSIGKFVSKILGAIGTFLHGAKDEAEVILTAANDIVNKLVAWFKTPEGVALETIIEGLVPPTLLAKFMLFLPVLFTDLNWAQTEAGKSDAAVLADAGTYINSLTGNVKAAQLNSFNALVGAWLSEQQNTGLTIQQTLTVAQVVHDPTVDTSTISDDNTQQEVVSA